MIRIENTEVHGFEPAIRGMRNPMNSWDKSDSGPCATSDYSPEHCGDCAYINVCGMEDVDLYKNYIIGPNDLSLMKKLAKAGSDHAKYRRMIVVYMDVTAPLYWWKEFDTYKVGTVANSCSTMHKIHEKEFEIEDFSCEHLDDFSWIRLQDTIEQMNYCRQKFINAEKIDSITDGLPDKKNVWWQMIQLLPSSYNQKRTVMLNYEVIANMYAARKNHKLDEWVEFCEAIEELPYSELITLEVNDDRPSD